MKKKYVKRLGGILSAAVLLAGFPAAGASAEGADYLADEALTGQADAAPQPDAVVPSANQYRYQKEELAAFCHFGPNTFNEIEWGEHYGSRHPRDIFTLSNDFDAETFVKSVKDAGFYKVIVTAKHHDGFCIWDSAYTDYDVAATDYPGDAQTGEKDILAEISAACTKYNVEMGLYLSPWDIHEPSYGYYDANRRAVSPDQDVLDYNEFYNNQLQEILGNEKYGNNGHFVEVWMDGAKGSGANAQVYDFPRWFDTIQKNEGKASGRYESDCMLFGAQAYTTVRWIGNEHGFAGKNTWSKSRVDYDRNTINSRREGSYTLGFKDGNQWTVPEADARITSGWFWGTRKAAPKSIEDLGTMYFKSVGHNAPLLLNIPPNNQGQVDGPILERVKEFGNQIRETFRNNLAAEPGASVKASSVRGNDRTYGPGRTTDGDDATYWTTDDGTNSASLLVSLAGAKKFDVVSVEEAIQHGQRINSYRVEWKKGNGKWQLLDEGETIGAKRLIRVPAVTADQVRITVSAPKGKVPMLSEIGVYKASRGFEISSNVPDGMEVVDIEDVDAADGFGFAFSGKWNKEHGNRFVNETNRWAGPGAELTLKFRGTKAYLIGTKDPNHGRITISVDGNEGQSIDTSAAKRQTGQVLFATEDLADGDHTLTLRVDSRAVGLEAAYSINNGGKGMIGLEKARYTMNEDETIQVKVLREGGASGAVQAYLSPNPGSAIQDDFYTEPVVVSFADGEKETTVPVRTRRNTNKTGTQDFTVELNGQSEGVMVGFIDRATINILDTESKVETKKIAFPSTEEETVSVEAEELVLDASEAAAGREIRVINKEASSNKKHVGWFENGNRIRLGYSVDRAGYYDVTLTYASGRPESKANNILFSGDKVETVMDTFFQSAPNDWGTVWQEKTVRLHIKEAGKGDIVLSTTNGGPNLDKLTIRMAADGAAKEPEEPAIPTEHSIQAAVTPDGAGRVEVSADTVADGGEVQVRVIPSHGYTATRLLVNGQEAKDFYGPTGTYILHGIKADQNLSAEFAKTGYTTEEPFVFPDGEEPVTLEAERFTLFNTETGNEKWKLKVVDRRWDDEQISFVNCLNSGDRISLPVKAEAGTYELMAYYRSGSTDNALIWNGGDLIEDGQVSAGASDASVTNTVKFNMLVNKTGSGVLTFEGPQGNSPQLDKFVIRLVEKAQPDTPKEALAILEGSGVSVTAGEAYKVRINGEPEQLTAVYLDEKELTNGTDYTVQRGSTIITLSGDVTGELAEGDHTLRTVFADGASIAGGELRVPFTLAAAEPADSEEPVETEPVDGAEEPAETEPVDGAETEPAETEPVDGAETEPVETKPADEADTPSETKPADGTEVSRRATVKPATGSQPETAKSADVKATGAKAQQAPVTGDHAGSIFLLMFGCGASAALAAMLYRKHRNV